MRVLLFLAALVLVTGCAKELAYNPVNYDRSATFKSARSVLAVVKTGEVTGGETMVVIPVSPGVMVPMQQVSRERQFNARDQYLFLLNLASELNKADIARVMVPQTETERLKAETLLEVVFLRTHANAYRDTFSALVAVQLQSKVLRFNKQYTVTVEGKGPIDGKSKLGLALMQRIIPDIEEYLRRLAKAGEESA